jgi:chromosome segregation ATPase
LKAKTPEEEYIANREAEIKEVKDKIKENEKAIEEVGKKLPSREEEIESKKKMVEEFSIRRLSEFLSDEELEIIKK